MAFPPDPIDAAVSGTIADPNEHPGHHNALAAAVNDIVAEIQGLGTASTADTGAFATASQGALADAAAPQSSTVVACIWNGSGWVTASGGAVPTSSSLIRHFHSQNDDAATAPTPYSDYDLWFGVSA